MFVGHEVRNPMQSIAGLADELEEICGEPRISLKELRRRAADISKHIMTASTLAVDVLNNTAKFLRGEQEEDPDTMEGNLHDVIKRACDAMHGIAHARQVEIKFAVTTMAKPLIESSVRLNGPFRCVQHIVVNLLTNAIKHSPPKSTVDVTLDCNSMSSSSLAIVVDDSGTGMSDAIVERLQSRWHHGGDADPKNSGWGVGMMVIQRRLQQLGGVIDLNTTVGKGTKARVSIPRHVEGTDAVALQPLHLPLLRIFDRYGSKLVSSAGNKSSSAGSQNSLHTLSPRMPDRDDLSDTVVVSTLPSPATSDQKRLPVVLVAEDNLIANQQLCRIVKGAGFDAVSSTNGKDCVENYELHKDRVHMVLMDLQMPIMDGFTAAASLLQENPSLPIVAITGAESTMESGSQKKRCYDIGFCKYMVKPVLGSELRDILENITTSESTELKLKES